MSLSDDLRADVERMIDVDVRSGLYDEAAILDAVREALVDELGEAGVSGDVLAPFRARLREGLERAAATEQAFPARTDNDRLDDAFADLAARGIVTGQAVGFTLQEGAAMMDEAVVELARGDEALLPRGSVFYHRQDLERAIEGGGLSLAFTSYAEQDGATAAIGREIVHTLKHHGLATRWDGTREQRIVVTPMRWQRRTTTSPAAGAGPAPPFVDAQAAPPPSAPCPRCGGKGWIQRDTSSFPEACGCKHG